MSDDIEYRGCIIRVEFDSDPMSPFEWDPSPTFISWNQRYHGDVNNKGRWSRDPSTLMEQIAEEKDIYAFAIRAYIHSGITVNLGPRLSKPETAAKELHEASNVYPFNDQWDSGWFGVLIFTKKQIESCYGNAEEFAQQAAENFVASWDNYLTGQIFCYISTAPNGEMIGSCSGFDDEQDMIEEAKREIDSWYEDQVPLFPHLAKDFEFRKVENETI